MFSIFQSKRVTGGDRVGGITFGVSSVYGGTGRKEEERWCKNGEIHRSRGPALTHYYENGMKVAENWYENGVRHRLSGPASTYYYKNGMISEESWDENGIIK